MGDSSTWLSTKPLRGSEPVTAKAFSKMTTPSQRVISRGKLKIQKPLEFFLKPKTAEEKTVPTRKINYSDYLLGWEKTISGQGADELSVPKDANYEDVPTDGMQSSFSLEPNSRESSYYTNLEDLSSVKKKELEPIFRESSYCTDLEDFSSVKKKELTDSHGMKRLRSESNEALVIGENRCCHCGRDVEGPCFPCIYKGTPHYSTELWKSDVGHSDTEKTHISESISFSTERTHVSETIRVEEESIETVKTHVSQSVFFESEKTHVSESIYY